MTNEEMAEEYAEKVVRHKMAVHDIFNEEEVTKKEIKDAIIYGLSIGKDMNVSSKWHKISAGDLPKDEFVDEYKHIRLPSAYRKIYCICLGDDYILGKYIRGCFQTIEGQYSLNEVLAWYEIPEYKE